MDIEKNMSGALRSFSTHTIVTLMSSEHIAAVPIAGLLWSLKYMYSR